MLTAAATQKWGKLAALAMATTMAITIDGDDDVSAEFTDGDCPTFDAVLPTDVTLQDYIAIDDCVATTGLLTDEEIINVTGGQEDHDSDEES